MTSYIKTMREAREEMLRSLNENNLEKMRKAAGGAKQTLKMKDGSIGMDSFTASAIMQIYDKINDKNKKTMENLLKDGKKADIVKLMKFAMSKVNAEYVPEEFEEEFELEEDIMPLIFGGGIIAGLLPVLYLSAKEIAGPSIGKLVDKLKKNKNYKMSDSEKSDIKRFVSKVKKDKPSLLQKAMKKIKEEVDLDEGPMDGFLRLTFKSPADVKKAMKVSDTEFGYRYFTMDKARTRPELDIEGDRDDLQRLKDALKSAGIKFEIDLEEEVELDEKLDKEDEPTIKKVVKMLKKASGAHAGQAKDLEKAMTEEDKLDEGKMKQLHQLMKDGKSAKEIAKIMKLDVKTIQALMDEKSELEEKRHIDPADIDISATDDDIKAADKNIMMQLRKSVSLRGQFPVEFLDKKKVKVPQKIALAVIAKYNSLRKPMDKEKFQAKIAKSHRDLLMGLKEGFASDAQRRAAFAQGYKAKGKKGKKESTLERMNNKIQERKNG